MEALGAYASDSDDEIEIDPKPKPKRKLPAPNLGVSRIKMQRKDAVSKDEGNWVRSFAHVDGNWPSHITSLNQ